VRPGRVPDTTLMMIFPFEASVERDGMSK
jgi:hypothetical protein